jgi:DNA integrity scanning protein DisA with diadenylate cyclase activity
MDESPADEKNSQKDVAITAGMLNAAAQVGKLIQARAIVTYLEGVAHTNVLKELVLDSTELILVVRDETSEKLAETLGFRCITVPNVVLSRIGQIKTAALIAFSQRLLQAGDDVVFVVGPAKGQLDTMMLVRIGKEWEIFQTVDHPNITEHVKRVVFERTLRIALELAAEGREGKPIGALFVIGDYRSVTEYCRQMILNPFKGYRDEINILDESVRDTIKSFATLEGAFIVKGNGVIASAGTHLKGLKSGEPLPQGLGARHAAAAGITASTKCLAVTISESTGTVRVWQRGQMITEIERPPHIDAGSIAVD